MTDEPTYRLDLERTVDGTTAVHAGEIYIPDVGVLVPDTRLQAIADAWNHLRALQQNGDYDSSVEEQRLAAAIEDALTEDNDG